MAKFKNTKKFTGVSSVTPPPVPQPKAQDKPRSQIPSKPQPQSQQDVLQKPRRAEPEIVKPIIPLASYTPEPKEEKRVEPEIRKPKIERSRQENRTVVEERPIQVKETAAKRKEVTGNRNGPTVKPKRIGTFVVIMFFTVILQIVLLFSLLYLSPSLVAR